jgi:hypothetical protein
MNGGISMSFKEKTNEKGHDKTRIDQKWRTLNKKDDRKNKKKMVMVKKIFSDFFKHD